MDHKIIFKDCYENQDNIEFSTNSQGDMLVSIKIKYDNEYINTSVTLDIHDVFDIVQINKNE